MKRTGIVIAFICVAGFSLQGQQLPLYSQYLYNKYLINPAVAGSDGYTSFNLTARDQWAGIEGSPKIFSISLQARVLKRGSFIKMLANDKTAYRPPNDGKMGFGGAIFSNSSGLINRTGIQASYSYHFWLNGSKQLSFGLSFNGYYLKIDQNRINMVDKSDPILNSTLKRGVFVPDVSTGIYLLHRKYSLGFSAEQVLQAGLKLFNNAYSEYSLKRHYYLFGAYSLEKGANHEIRPSFILKMSEQLKPQAEAGITYQYKQSFWTGVSYRTSKTFIANLGVRSGRLYIGYAVDFTLMELQSISNGTHEITVAIKYGDTLRKFRWIDRY